MKAQCTIAPIPAKADAQFALIKLHMRAFNDRCTVVNPISLSQIKLNAVFVILMACIIALTSGCAPALVTAAMDRDTERVRTLLNAGADVNSRLSMTGDTALHWAAYYGSIDIIKLLLEKGADVNAINGSRETPLNRAARGNHVDIINFLLNKGADVDSAIAASEALAAQYPNPQHGYAADAKLLAKFAAKKKTGAAPAVSNSNNESRPSSAVKSDIDDLPAAMARSRKNAYAIVIGIENYRQKLPRADFAMHDAQTVTEYLAKVLGYPEENVIMLLNEHATNVDLVKYFEKWLPNNVEKDGTVFVYFSGHGAPNAKTGDAYLVPYDGDPSFIDETGFSLKRMYSALGKLPAKEIIVTLDSCFSGAGGRSVIAKGSRPLVMNLQNTFVLPKNMTVLSASSSDQTSSTYDEKGHGLFTYFLLKGIKNEDVVKPDGSIKVDDLYGYIKPQVERIARKQYNNVQTPQLIEPKKN